MTSLTKLSQFVRRGGLLFGCCLLLVTVPGVARAEELLKGGEQQLTLDQQLIEKLAAMDCPGALVGVFPDKGEPQRFALGVADVKTREPMAFDMHMRVGSLMKPLLGAVVLQLAAERKISLDDPISQYVDNVPRGDSITLRMLGTNTSGLFNTIENKKFQKAIMDEPGRQWTPAEILSFNETYESYNQPGEAWRYSNTNAVLLGLVVEKVTGHSYVEELEAKVIKPLKLTATGVPTEAALPTPTPSAYRNGYPTKVIGYGNVFYDVSNYSSAWTGAAGNLYSTLDDIGRAAKPLATGQLLNDAGRAELHKWIATPYPGVKYGFMMYRRDGGIGHTGDVPGFNAYMAYDPELKTSVVAMTNLSNNADGTMPADELAKLVIAYLRRAR
jgi:D-alanyl-D-alanine carboxypeptidase